MTRADIRAVRDGLELTQEQFAQLLGVHTLTVSKWERGRLSPTPYQVALIQSFRRATENSPSVGLAAVGVLVGAGVTAALFMLLKAAFSDDDPPTKSPSKTPPRARR